MTISYRSSKTIYEEERRVVNQALVVVKIERREETSATNQDGMELGENEMG